MIYIRPLGSETTFKRSIVHWNSQAETGQKAVGMRYWELLVAIFPVYGDTFLQYERLKLINIETDMVSQSLKYLHQESTLLQVDA